MPTFPYRGKSIFYAVHGQGQPVVFLHGNTASSRMFEPLLPLYAQNFQCILLDFLGNGQSDRVDRFPPDVWREEALQVIALTEHLHRGKVFLIGTSGGAWAAINAALERPDLFCAVAADSFDGRSLHDRFAADLRAERAAAKADPQTRQFYAWCQGTDWERVVDLDTEALLRCAEEERPLFCRPLTELRVPVLLTGSREDAMVRGDLEREYREMAALIPRATVRMFTNGGHPAILTNAEAAAQAVEAFFLACPAM